MGEENSTNKFDALLSWDTNEYRRMPNAMFAREIADMSRDELAELKLELDEINHSIQAQIDESQAWYRGAKRALNSCKEKSQRIQLEFKRRGNKLSFPQAFMNVAEERIPADSFEALRILALELMEKET